MASIKANCRKIVCIGRNYADHISELSSARPSRPFFFLKPPSSLLTPNGGPIIRPRGTNLHHEVELGLLISRRLKDLPLSPLPDAATVSGAVGGYCLAIDLTARNVQEEAKRKGLPWTSAKGFDTFCPVGEVVPADRVRNGGGDVVIWLRVNGVERQRGWTGEMLFGIPRLLAEVSRVMTLEEGDLVLTGTPSGVASLVAGDRVECGMEVEGTEVVEARIQVAVEDAGVGGYEFEGGEEGKGKGT